MVPHFPMHFYENILFENRYSLKALTVLSFSNNSIILGAFYSDIWPNNVVSLEPTTESIINVQIININVRVTMCNHCQ